MTITADFSLRLSRAMVAGSILAILVVAFLPPSPASPRGAGEALFARFILWAAVTPLSVLVILKLRRLRGGSFTIAIRKRLEQSAAMSLLCATCLLWDVVAMVLYYLGLANVHTSMLVLGLATASAVAALVLARRP